MAGTDYTPFKDYKPAIQPVTPKSQEEWIRKELQRLSEVIRNQSVIIQELIDRVPW